MHEWLSEFINSTSGLIILAILATCTIRDVIARMGVIPRRKEWLERLIYGKYDEDLIERTLLALGYPRNETHERYRKLKKYIENKSGVTIVTRDNAPVLLILLLAKYTAKFPSPIAYGGNTLSNSLYYVNTMEIPHNEADSKMLCDIMLCLLREYRKDTPSIIFAPKSGNPLLADKLANRLDIPAVFVKDIGDRSKVQINGEKDAYKINYEGLLQIKDLDQQSSNIVIDCNISGGTQIRNVVERINTETETNVTEVYILFRVDDYQKNVQETFEQMDVKLYRFFDLNEERKKEIYEIKKTAEEEQRMIDYEDKRDIQKAIEIIDRLKQEKKYYYSTSRCSWIASILER